MADSSRAMREAIATLPADRFEAFVAALMRARGRSISRDGHRLTEEAGPDGATRTLVVYTGDDDRSIPDDVDVVVHGTPEPPSSVPADATVQGPGALVEQLRYAIDRPDAERLVREYLGDSTVPELAGPGKPGSGDDGSSSAPEGTDRDPAGDDTDPGEDAQLGETQSRKSATPSPEPTGDEAASSDIEREATVAGTGIRRRDALVGAGAFLVGAGAITAAGLVPLGGSTDGEPGSQPTPPGEDGGLVPVAGLSTDGVGSPRTFAVGHVDTLEETAFTIDSRKTIHAADGRLLASTAIETRVAADRRFQVSAAVSGPAAEPLFQAVPAQAQLWSDGETYRRQVTADGETRTESYRPSLTVNEWYLWSSVFPFDGPPVSAFEFYRDVFEAIPVSVATTETGGPFTLTAENETLDPAPLLFDAIDAGSRLGPLALLGVVTDAGLIRSLQLDYAALLDDAPVDVHWTIGYTDVGETSVERPAWAAEENAE